MRFQNVTSMTDFFTVANTITDGWLVYSIIFGVFIVALIIQMANGIWKSLVYSTFVTGIVILLFRIAGYIDSTLMIVDGLLMALGLFMTWLEKRG